MAIVKGPALSIAASGNVGAICYSTFRGMKIAKAAWSGTVPNTTKQVAQQALLTNVSQAWGTSLDSDERETWSNLAKNIIWKDRLGDPYIPNGYQLFMKWNIRRKVMNLTLLQVAPTVQDWVNVDYLLGNSQAAGTQVRLDLRSDNLSVISYAVEWYKVGPFDSGGRNPREGEWLYLARRVPPSTWNDYDVITMKWYWYRARAVAIYGDVQNWFQKQVYMAP